MRVRTVAIVAGCLVAAAFTVPIVPCSLPRDVWPEADFARVKAEIQAVDPHLTQLYLNSTKNSAKGASTPRHSLVAKYGAVAEYRPLIGSWSIGWRREATWSFGVPALPNMPHVRADAKTRTFQVTPDTLEAFLAWARAAKLDAVTGEYVAAE